MEIIRHRVNTPTEILSLAPEMGAEVDLRSENGQIILQHDAFKTGAAFETFLELWVKGPPRGTLILNPKEDGLETEAVKLLQKWNIERFFFIDLTLPTLVRLSVKEGFRKLAVRVSQYEPLEAAFLFDGRAEWAWLDCFNGVPPEPETLDILRSAFQTCLVSPELHGFPSTHIEKFRGLSAKVDAVCTKHPEMWIP